MIVTGIAPANKGEKGALVFLDSETLAEQRRVAIGEGTVVRVVWHSRINQVSGTRAAFTRIIATPSTVEISPI